MDSDTVLREAAAISCSRTCLAVAFGQPRYPRSRRPTSEPDDAEVPGLASQSAPGRCAHRGRAVKLFAMRPSRSGAKTRAHLGPDATIEEALRNLKDSPSTRKQLKPLEEFTNIFPGNNLPRRSAGIVSAELTFTLPVCAQRSGRLHSAVSKNCSSLTADHPQNTPPASHHPHKSKPKALRSLNHRLSSASTQQP